MPALVYIVLCDFAIRSFVDCSSARCRQTNSENRTLLLSFPVVMQDFDSVVLSVNVLDSFLGLGLSGCARGSRVTITINVYDETWTFTMWFPMRCVSVRIANVTRDLFTLITIVCK